MVKQNKIAFTGPFGDTNFGDWAMIVNNIRSMAYHEIVLFSYGPVFNQEIVETYLADYNIEIVEVLLDDFDEKSHFPHTPVEILGRVKNLDAIKDSLRSVDKLIVNGGGYFNDEWTEGRMVKLFKIFTPMLLADQMNMPIIFTANSLGPFDLGKGFFTNMFGRMKNLRVAARDQMYSKIWFDQLHTPHEVTFIPDDLLFIHPDLKRMAPTIQVDSDGYVVLEAYQPLDVIASELDAIKAFVGDMKHQYNLDVVFLPLNIGNGGTDQGRYLKERIPELILVDYSDKGYLPIQDAVNILRHAEMVITSRYHALVLSVANQVPILSVMKDEVGDKRYYYNKNGGLIQQVFNGLEVDETRLMKRNFTEAFDLLKFYFKAMVEEQKDRYESQIFQENIIVLNQLRLDYIKDFIDD